MQIEKAEIISAFEKFSALQVTQNEKLSEIASKMRAEELLHSGFDQYYLEQQNLKFRIAKNGERIKKLESELAEGETTSQEIEDLKQENKILNDALSNGAYSSLSQLVNLTAKGEEILRRNDVDYSDSYIRYLTHIRNNGLYLDHYDADMRNILRLYIQQINAPYIYQA
jgi:predicted  nucleic acid-binding Zn-ribbon protein